MTTTTVTPAAAAPASNARAWVLGGLTVAAIAAQVFGLFVPYLTGSSDGGWTYLAQALVIILVPFVYLGVLVAAAVELRKRWPAPSRRAPLVAVAVLAAAAMILLYLPLGPTLVWLAD